MSESIEKCFRHGYSKGREYERNRIINLIVDEAREWLSHDGTCDCRIKGEELKRIIKLLLKEKPND